MNQIALFDVPAPEAAPAAVDEHGFLIESTSRAPGQRFVRGDRVRTRWGDATVLKAYERPYFDSPRSYLVRHDWSDGPPGFGHHFGENECEPGRPRRNYEEDPDA